MHKRPAPVTIVGWFLTIRGIAAVLVSIYGVLSSNDDPNVQNGPETGAFSSDVVWSVGLVSAAVSLLCGINVLNGRNWARLLYAVTCVGFLFFDWIAFSETVPVLFMSTLIRMLFITFLFLPEANGYFAPRKRRRWRYTPPSSLMERDQIPSTKS